MQKQEEKKSRRTTSRRKQKERNRGEQTVKVEPDERIKDLDTVEDDPCLMSRMLPVSCSSLGKASWTGERAISKHCRSPFSPRASTTDPSGWAARLVGINPPFTWLSTLFSTYEKISVTISMQKCTFCPHDWIFIFAHTAVLYDIDLVEGEDGAVHGAEDD